MFNLITFKQAKKLISKNLELEKRINQLENELILIRTTVNSNAKKLNDVAEHYRTIYDMLNLEDNLTRTDRQKNDLKEKIVSLIDINNHYSTNDIITKIMSNIKKENFIIELIKRINEFQLNR